MPRTRSLLLVFALAAWVSCGTPGPSDDAGSDAGLDAGRDAGRDAAAVDTGPPDGGPTDPEWVSIAAGLPTFCRLERANHPERLDAIRARFSPCSSRDNCMMTGPIANAGWIASDGTYGVGAVIVDGWQWIFVSPLDGGAPIAAYRGGTAADPVFCALGFGTIGGGRFAMGTSYSSEGVSGASVFVAPLSDAGNIAGALFDDHTDFASSFIQGLFVSESALVLWDSGGFFADVSTGAFVRMYDAAGPRVIEDSVSVAGDTVMFEAADSPVYIAVGHAGVLGGSELYRAMAGIDAQQPLTDGVDIGWIEAVSGSTTAPLKLWTAAFTTSSSALVPTYVRTIDAVSDPRIGGGLWVDFRGTPSRFQVFDLHGGGRRSFETPVEIAGRDLLYVAADRVLYASGSSLVQFDPRAIAYDDEPDAGM